MILTAATGAVTLDAESTFAWERYLRPALEAIDPGERASRALVMGIAGSGKSRMLRHLQRAIREDGREATLLTAEEADVSRVPASHVALVDDLHLMSPDQLERIRTRIDDPRAAIIATSRPWPSSTAAKTVGRELERARPAIMLGHLTRADVLDQLARQERTIDDACLDHILLRTAGVPWLVTQALAAHDPRDCAHDPSHTSLERSLGELIAHRLDMVDPARRTAVELLCVAAPSLGTTFATTEERDDAVLWAYSEGLTTRNGSPVPIVRASVRETMPVHRIIDLREALTLDNPAAAASVDDLAWIAASGDPRAGTLLAEHADTLLETAPASAAELYRGAIDAGVAPESVLYGRVQAAWAVGDLDRAASLVDEALPSVHEDDRPADLAAAVWAARGMMHQADAVYRALPPRETASRVRAVVAALGDGNPVDMDGTDGADVPPTALGVALRHLGAGLRTSLDAEAPERAVVDLVRASELFTAARSTAPMPELPAVIAAIAALSLGDLDTARSVIDDAIAGDHGGAPARSRLQLWRAWVAVQSARPGEARTAIARAGESPGLRSPRDHLLAQTLRIAIARRYEDAAGLEAAWAPVRATLMRVDIDLYLLLPLAELVCSAAKVGESERIATHLAHAVELVTRLGSPPLWSTHLHWAGIQEGILRNRPEALAPHARALVAAGANSAVAATMSRAGRVWTSVLAGSVDPDAVEAGARGLAAIGLAWDAARLAGHGAGRTDDRRVSARLLACARELHPNDPGPRSPAAEGEEQGSARATAGEELLSDRELEVARLVLQGKTYAEIGEAIFISPRTAEHHIAHIRRRLGAASRSDMISRLRVLMDDQKGFADGPP